MDEPLAGIDPIAVGEIRDLGGLLQRAGFALPVADAAGTLRWIGTGTDIAIDDRAATPLALLFHELATNASKYGALSVPEKNRGSPEVAASTSASRCDSRLATGGQ